MDRLSRSRLKGLVFLGVAAVIWGVNFPVVKYLLISLPPFTMRGVAGIAGAGFAFVLAGCRGDRLRPAAGTWLSLGVDSLLNFTLWIALVSYALYWLPAGETSILAYTVPIWAVLFAWPLLRERPTLFRAVGLVVGMVGVAALMDDQSLRASYTQLPGALMALGGAAAVGLGTVVTKRRQSVLSPLVTTAWQGMLGSVPLLVIGLLFEKAQFSRLTLLDWTALSYIGFVAFTVGYLAWFSALRLLPASTTAIGTLLIPPVGVLSATIMLGEPLGWRQIAALALTIAGATLGLRGHS
jgi:drug/metabolite transporter (DMT)-like permease